MDLKAYVHHVSPYVCTHYLVLNHLQYSAFPLDTTAVVVRTAVLPLSPPNMLYNWRHSGFSPWLTASLPYTKTSMVRPKKNLTGQNRPWRVKRSLDGSKETLKGQKRPLLVSATCIASLLFCYRGTSAPRVNQTCWSNTRSDFALTPFRTEKLTP